MNPRRSREWKDGPRRCAWLSTFLSDLPLRTWPFSKEKPGFYVAEVELRYASVKQQFSKPFVDSVGAYEGCGCGFQYGREAVERGNDPIQLAAANQCREAIAAYVQEALLRSRRWKSTPAGGGDEKHPANSRRAIAQASFPDGFVEGESF